MSVEKEQARGRKTLRRKMDSRGCNRRESGGKPPHSKECESKTRRSCGLGEQRCCTELQKKALARI